MSKRHWSTHQLKQESAMRWNLPPSMLHYFVASFVFQFCKFLAIYQTSVRKNPASSNIVHPQLNTAFLSFFQSSQFKQTKTLLFLIICSFIQFLSFQVYLHPSHGYSLFSKLFSFSDSIPVVKWRQRHSMPLRKPPSPSSHLHLFGCLFPHSFLSHLSFFK